MERDTPIPKEAALTEPLEVNFDSIPERLRSYPHFVVWNYATIDEEIKKPPFDPKTLKAASVRRSDTWGSFDDALAAYETGQFSGIGIVLTSDMGIVGIDIDHCIETGQTSDEAQRIITALNSYTETSPSETGIRIMLEGKLPGAFRRHGNIEMYEDMRYLTLTGHSLTKTPIDIQPRHRELYGLYHRLWACIIKRWVRGSARTARMVEYEQTRSVLRLGKRLHESALFCGVMDVRAHQAPPMQTELDGPCSDDQTRRQAITGSSLR